MKGLLWVPIFAAAVAVGYVVDAGRTSCGRYVDSAGQSVPRPCGNWLSLEPPAGATARCRDGSWSWSQHPDRSWTCSGHWGVAYRL